ncbi:MAG: ChaN family lipoprotein [Candidatus Sabulitectum sp.]|nr:ChaN family lipoprotein [Candidatus Sabulitectum sp.]
MVPFMLMCAITAVPGGVIYSGAEMVTAAEMIEALQGVDIVFIGEKHDDSFAHEWELFIWEALASDNRALALEMFETDVQPLLNEYLAGEVSENVFLEGARPWGNYQTDYAPMVEFARENGFSVIAANVPRMYAAMVARGGFSAVLAEPGFEDISVDSSNILYKEVFLATMEAIGDQMHGMPVAPENLYRAQLLKDAVMARSISGEKVVFVCGSFHSDFHSGIPDQISSDSYLTVTVLGEGEEFSPDLADFVIFRQDQ